MELHACLLVGWVLKESLRAKILGALSRAERVAFVKLANKALGLD
jgi:hypothetical protein